MNIVQYHIAFVYCFALSSLFKFTNLS